MASHPYGVKDEWHGMGGLANGVFIPLADVTNYLLFGSEKDGKSAAICYPLLETCKLNNINPQSWRTCALANIQDTKLFILDKILPSNYIE